MVSSKSHERVAHKCNFELFYIFQSEPEFQSNITDKTVQTLTWLTFLTFFVRTQECFMGLTNILTWFLRKVMFIDIERFRW